MAPLRLRDRQGGSARSLENATDRVKGFYEAGNRLVGEPFVGVRTEDGVVPNLFELEHTGIPNDHVRAAVAAFLDCLDDKEREAAIFDLDSDAWRRWSNIQNFLMRHGVCLDDLSHDQREKAIDILRAVLSEDGAHLARAAMARNGLLGEISNLPDEFGEWLYWVSVFGTPSETEPWGFQFDGHHVNFNCFVLGDQMVMTPYFLGSEPESEEYAPTRLLGPEERGGLELYRSLDVKQRRRALLPGSPPNDVRTTSFMDNVVLKNEGIAYTDLTPGQQQALLGLLRVYLARMPEPHAERRMAELERHLGATYFVWQGADDDERPFYFRIQNPVGIFEFCHIEGVVFDRSLPNRNHVHTVIRTPNGNDYGKVLLDLYRREQT